MTGDTRTLAVQIPEELFLRLDAYLKRSGIKSKKQFLISLIEAALAEGETEEAEQPEGGRADRGWPRNRGRRRAGMDTDEEE